MNTTLRPPLAPSSLRESQGEPILEAREVTFSYPGAATPTLRDLSLQLPAGELTALIGPNGAGKSTLLRLLCGLLAPQKGVMLLEGAPLQRSSRRSLARRIAVLPQRLQVSFDADVETVVALGRTPHRAPLGTWWGPPGRDHEAVETALAETDTARFRDRPLGALSGGEQQRVALALALAQEADVLLLDEPTSHLDPVQAQAVLDLVQGLRRQRHLTVIAVLHDLNLASLYATRILLLHQGELIADGPPPDVIRPDILEPVYGPALRYVLHPDHPLPQVLPRATPPENPHPRGGGQ
jgi:iron complex transport system ATP-binding protein